MNDDCRIGNGSFVARHHEPQAHIERLEQELAAMTQDRNFAVDASGISRRLVGRLQAELAAVCKERDELAEERASLVEALRTITRLPVKFDSTWQELWKAIKIADTALTAYKTTKEST